MRSKRIVLLALLLSSLGFISGCAVVLAGGAGAGTVAYIKGELQGTLDASLSRSLQATNRSLQSLRYVKVSQEADSTQADITARTAEDAKLSIKLSRLTDHATKISIRVGLFGDRTVSQNLLDEIRRKLKPSRA